jgi:hypothetical protein
MNESKKLTIRINFRPEKDPAPEEKKRWTYHWGRIIGISLTAIVAIALLVSGGSYYLNQDQIDSESVADKIISSSLKKETVQMASQKESQLTATRLLAAEKSAPKIESRKTPSVASNEPVGADKTKDITILEPAEAEKKFVSEHLFTQYRKKSLSDNVSRFIISQAVKSNEPIGTLENIHFDSNNIATVYAYSDVNGLKDQTVYYQWSLNGKNIAKIKVKVGANRWRSYSSKFIQPNMHGEWKVELQNQAGENLAINQFSY